MLYLHRLAQFPNLSILSAGLYRGMLPFDSHHNPCLKKTGSDHFGVDINVGSWGVMG